MIFSQKYSWDGETVTLTRKRKPLGGRRGKKELLGAILAHSQGFATMALPASNGFVGVSLTEGNLLMSINKEAALAASVATVAPAAFRSGTSKAELVANVLAVCGPRPPKALFARVRLEICVGLMAAALAAKGDNRPQAALFVHCRDRIQNYQGFGGKGQLRNGMKGRRTEIEEKAYKSSTVQLSGILGAASVRNPEARGGARGTNKPKSVGTKVDGRKMTAPRLDSSFAVNAKIQQHAVELLALINVNAKVRDNAAMSTVQDFYAAAKKLPTNG